MSNATQKKKPTYIKCNQLEPGTSGHNLILKVVNSTIVVEKTRTDSTKIRIAEALVGDETGSIVLTARNDQVDIVEPGNTIEVRNAKIDMFKGYMRLAVDKWGKISKYDRSTAFEVDTSNNLSNVEYELVPIQGDEQ
eukprot:TRINITY_DN2206_c0_g2_i1.p1 TRINITY_DN2206_c0_g2~~TRINITY_DN2206_c0_g2_i1.p1  ORF type:complete len:146 (-),score=25.58 TRINITY_DN2206_c0_g2_i1:128-538(-)